MGRSYSRVIVFGPCSQKIFVAHNSSTGQTQTFQVAIMNLKIVEPGSSKPKSESIILQTRKGTVITNKQIIEEISDDDFVRAVDRIRASHIGAIARPHTVSKIYNCHGMTFACRRTGIDQLSEISKILDEDNYQEVQMSDLLAGDIVLYFEENGEVSHSGLVIKIASTPTFKAETLILSKWGDTCEVIHTLYNCPYPPNVHFFRCIN